MIPNFNGSEDLEKIHQASMRIIGENGFHINCDDTVALLKKNGVKVEGKTAFFTPEQVMERVGKAPSQFTIHARNSKWDMKIGQGDVHCAPAFGSAFIKETDGTLRPGSMADYIKLVKLFHQCDSFKINGGILVQPDEVDTRYAMSMELLATAIHSDKCFLSGAGGLEESETQMEMLRILFGDEGPLNEKARMVAVMNVNSPMQFDKTQLDTLRVFTAHGQAVGINCGIAAGNSGPITLAGAIALGNAEVLTGVAISQMMVEGAKVFYGLPIAQATDMKTGGTAIGGPETSIGTRFGSRLAKAYGLPTRSCGSPTDAKGVFGAQNGYESAFLLFNNYEAGADLVVHAAGVMDSYMTTSLEKCVIDFEIIRMCERFMKGVSLNEEDFALDVIQQVGAGGLYLTSPHTFKHCRQELFGPDLGFRGANVDNPDQAYADRVEKKLADMLDSYTRPDISAGMVADLTALLASKGYEIPSALNILNGEELETA